MIYLNYNTISKHNRKLYESIMKDVSKIIKKQLLKENQDLSDDAIQDKLNNLYNKYCKYNNSSVFQ